MINKRILVVDDNEPILEVIYEALTYEQYTVKVITQGKALFTAVHEFNPDLVLLDYKLADTNGGDLCKQLKSISEYQHIPVIITSAYINPSQQASLEGCDGLLYKPFDLDNLVAVVGRHLNNVASATEFS